jgi:hypothetical protein
MLNHEKYVHPSLEELVISLGREPRWCGRTGRNLYTVLHHSFLTEYIISDMLEGKPVRYRDNVRLYSLIHDLHEGVTGDIPTPLKSDEIRADQLWIDGHIYRDLGIPCPSPKYRHVIKIADERALCAEAAVLKCRGLHGQLALEYAGKSHYSDELHVEALLKEYGTSSMTNQLESRGVQDFLASVRELVGICNRLTKDAFTEEGEELIEYPVTQVVVPPVFMPTITPLTPLC